MTNEKDSSTLESVFKIENNAIVVASIVYKTNCKEQDQSGDTVGSVKWRNVYFNVAVSWLTKHLIRKII